MTGNRRDFDHSMEGIEVKVIELFALVAEDLPAATKALLDGAETAKTLAEREQVIDALYLEVEELAGRQILLQAPVAADLRFLLTVLRVVPELERSHDLVVDIASRTRRIRIDDLCPLTRELTGQMGDLAARMWQQAADAWYNRDRSAVETIAGDSAEIDQLHGRLTSAISSGGMPVPETMEMTLAARDYQRLGAHAVNITRRVAYLAGGARLPLETWPPSKIKRL